jgi:hypothetical protein
MGWRCDAFLNDGETPSLLESTAHSHAPAASICPSSKERRRPAVDVRPLAFLTALRRQARLTFGEGGLGFGEAG